MGWDGFVETERYSTFSYRINKNLPIFNFMLVGMFEDKYGNFLVDYMEIFNTYNKKSQKFYAKDRFDVIGDGWSSSDMNFASLVQFIDLNFDGYLDLSLLSWTGATGNNNYASYIYNPTSGKFIYHNEISNLSGVKVDAKKKRIITYNRMGWCGESMEYFKVISNKLVLAKIEWTEIDQSRDDGTSSYGCFKYTGSPRNKNVKIDAYKILSMENIHPYMRARFKNIKEERLYESLDGRERSPLGTPMD